MLRFNIDVTNSSNTIELFLRLWRLQRHRTLVLLECYSAKQKDE